MTDCGGGWDDRLGQLFFPSCLILVVLEAETERIELCTWCCQITLFPTRPLPITHQKCSCLASVLSFLHAYNLNGNARVGISACSEGVSGGSQVWCRGALVFHSSHCNIQEGFDSSEDATAALGVLHNLKPVGVLPV